MQAGAESSGSTPHSSFCAQQKRVQRVTALAAAPNWGLRGSRARGRFAHPQRMGGPPYSMLWGGEAGGSSDGGSGARAYRHDVHALAAEGVEVRWQHSHQCLAFARAHLRNLPLVEDDAADELDVERAQAEHALGRLARHLFR